MLWGRLILVWSVALSSVLHSKIKRNSLFLGGKRTLLISNFFFKRGVTLQSLGTSWEREWQEGREDSSLRNNGLLVLWGKGQNRSKKRDQEGLGEWERLFFFFLPPTPLFLLTCPVPFRASCAVVRRQLFCRLRIRVLPVSNASLVYS